MRSMSGKTPASREGRNNSAAYYNERTEATFMARIALIEPEQASPEVKEIYEQKLKGKPGNVQKALGASPRHAEELPRFLRQRWPFT